MDVTVGIVCDRGLNPKRPVNQDSYLAIEDRGLFAVFDGVGGQRAGEVASQTAAETIEESLAHGFPDDSTRDSKDDSTLLVRRAIQFANRDIFELAESDPEYKTMATTIALVLLDGNQATIAHVGDSRVYRLEDGSLFRETIDHTDLHDGIRAGLISADQAALHQDDHVINRALGAEPDVDVEIKTIDLRRGDRLLLCTDGIYRHLTDNQIADVLARYKDPQRTAEELKRIVHERGADDNLTAVVVHIRDLSPAPARPALKRKSHGSKASGRLRGVSGNLGGKEATGAIPGKRISVDLAAGIKESGPGNRGIASEAAGYGEGTSRGPGLNYLIYGLLSLVLLAGGFYAGLREADLVNKRSSKAAAPAASDQMAAGRDAFERRDYPAAAAAFAAIQQREPQNAQASYWLGRSQLEQGQYAEAARSLEQALTLAPGMHDAYVQAAAALEAAGEKTRASEMLQRYAQERKKPVDSSQ